MATVAQNMLGFLGGLAGGDNLLTRTSASMADPVGEMQLRRDELELRRAERAAELDRQKAARRALEAAAPRIAQRYGIPEETVPGLGVSGISQLGNIVAPSGGTQEVLAQRLMAENPNLSFSDALGQVQSGFRQGLMLRGGQAAPIPGYGGALGSIAGAQERGQTLGGLQARAEMAPQVIEAEEAARIRGAGEIPEREKEERQRRKNKITATMALSQSFDDAENINQVIDTALGQASAYTTALFGALTEQIPGTPAADLAANLRTLEADAAFDRLQQMRDSSPTGGALGQVSERELSLLGSARASLLQSQSQKQFRKNLARYKDVRNKALINTAEAYKETYGAYPEGVELMIEQLKAPAQDLQQLSDEELLRLIGGN